MSKSCFCSGAILFKNTKKKKEKKRKRNIRSCSLQVLVNFVISCVYEEAKRNWKCMTKKITSA